MREVISIVGGKGGVGKTSISINIAQILAEYGVKTLLVDCDINTYGATMFYRLANLIPRDLQDIVTMKKLFQSIIDSDIFEERFRYTDCKGIKVANNLDFIPALSDLRHSELMSDSKEDLERIKKPLCDLIQMWNEKYEVIIFDHSAGYNNLIDLMVTVSTKIFLIREHNLLSVEASRGLFKKMQMLDIPIVGCINKIPPEEYKAVPDVIEGIIPECTGFIYDENIAKKTAMGELLCKNLSLKDTCSKEYGKAIERMITFLLPEFVDAKKKYEEELDKKEEEERNRKLIKKEKKEKERYTELKKYFKLFHRMFIPFCIVITILILVVTGNGIGFLFPALVLSVVFVVVLGCVIVHRLDLYDELGKYYSEIIHKFIEKRNQAGDDDKKIDFWSLFFDK